MPFTIDTTMLLYITISLFIVQFIIMRYYVQSNIDDNNQKNNKKLIKKISHQIGSTFDQYMGKNTVSIDEQPINRIPRKKIISNGATDNNDSINDPATDDDIDIDKPQETDSE